MVVAFNSKHNNEHTHTHEQKYVSSHSKCNERNQISSITLSNILGNGSSVNHEFPNCFQLLISIMSSPVLKRLIFKEKKETKQR